MDEPIGNPMLPGGEDMKHAPDISPNKLNPRNQKAEVTKGNAEVETPWETSHQITRKNGPHWETHHANSSGLPGQKTWEAKKAQRGGDNGPEQRTDPWPGMNTPDHTDATQSYT